MNYLNTLLSNSNSDRQSLRLPVELFRTPENYYIFDANQVRFIEANKVVFKIVSILKHTKINSLKLAEVLPEFSTQEINEALCEIENIQKQGYLNSQEFQRATPYTLEEIKDNLTNNMKVLYLNVTSKCNLSCLYCMFGGNYDRHGKLKQQNMTWETAQKAIDFFFSRAATKGRLRVDFFGGEPLIAFHLLKRIIKTVKEEMRRRNQELLISIASNGTIMNDKIADFLIKNNVLFQISIDGEKELHDYNRKFKANKMGSFDIILKNLQLLHDRDIEYFLEWVRLKGVVSTESLNYAGSHFFQIPLIKTLKKQNHFVMLGKNPQYNIEKDDDFFSRVHKLGKLLLEKNGANSIEELIADFDFKQKHLFHITFFQFFYAQVSNFMHFDIDKPVPFSKDCMIGYEGCVNVDGSISICYSSNSFIIGNVIENSWYFDKINEYYQKRYSLPKCQNCFVRRFCMFCYEKIAGTDEQIEISIEKYCEFNRYYIRLIFEYMLNVVEKNPVLWDELQIMAEQEKERLLKVQAERKNETSEAISS